MTKDEALKLALEWFEGVDEDPAYGVQGHQVIAAIKEALAQSEPEPVAWMSPNKEAFVHAEDVGNSVPNWTDYYTIPLYTTPPQRKPLTDEEIILIVADCASSHQHTDIHFARAIEAAVWEKQK